MQLSVIVPVRNGAPFIAALFDSLKAQATTGLDGCEFIIVDDASTDDTPVILANYPWLRVLRHDARRGAGAARNTGAKAASGRILIFLDADTRVRETDFLVRCAAFFDRNPDYDAVSGCYYDENPAPHRFARYLDVSETMMREAALDQPAPGSLSGSICGLRKHVFDAMGGFSEDPRVALEDPELGCRLGQRGHRHWFSGSLRVEHRQPMLWQYAKELVPRTRHYLHLIRHFGAYNEVMGGQQEGRARILFAMGTILLAGGSMVPAIAYPGILLLVAAGWQARKFWWQLFRKEGIGFIPAALFFHVVTTSALVAGGLLGVIDVVRFSCRRRLIDISVLIAYLRSLLAKESAGYLIHFLTHRCNARCAHCFDEPQRQRLGKNDELDLPRIRRLAAKAGPLGHVSLTGGEPLLRDDIAGIVAAYYTAGVRSFSISSNGSYPERVSRLLAKLSAAAPLGRIIVTISVDSIGARHDQLRGLPGLYEKVERSLRVLCEARQWLPQLRVHVSTTLTHANAADIDKILAKMRIFRPDQFEVTRLRGKPADPALQGIDDAAYDIACARVKVANGGALGLARLFSRLDNVMFKVVRQPDKEWPCGTCLAGRRLAVILADGVVLPCEMLRSVRTEDAAAYQDFTLGRLDAHGDDLGALLASPQARRITDYIRDTECRCSFECAIFATMAYRPWRLWRFFRMPPKSGRALLITKDRKIT